MYRIFAVLARYFLNEHSIESLNYLNPGESHQDLHQDKQRFDLWKVAFTFPCVSLYSASVYSALQCVLF